MSDNDDDFKDIETGLPSANTVQKSSLKFLAIFLVGAIIIAAVVLQFGESITDALGGSFGSNFIPPQMLMNGLISLLLGSLQAWIFKSKIKARLAAFIGFSLLGGVVGGLVGGILMNSGLSVFVAFGTIIGAVNGLLAGGISSLVQNRLMGNKKYGARWFWYNALSWGVIFSIAWTVAWEPDNNLLIAVAGAFLLMASGVSLVLFLRKTPQIEFS